MVALKEMPNLPIIFIKIIDTHDYFLFPSFLFLLAQVIITGLYATENNQVVTFDRPVKAISLDPLYYMSNSGRQYVTGDDKVSQN